MEGKVLILKLQWPKNTAEVPKGEFGCGFTRGMVDQIIFSHEAQVRQKQTEEKFEIPSKFISEMISQDFSALYPCIMDQAMLAEIRQKKEAIANESFLNAMLAYAAGREPDQQIYKEDIPTFDFSSLYPSIMMSILPIEKTRENIDKLKETVRQESFSADYGSLYPTEPMKSNTLSKGYFEASAQGTVQTAGIGPNVMPQKPEGKTKLRRKTDAEKEKLIQERNREREEERIDWLAKCLYIQHVKAQTKKKSGRLLKSDEMRQISNDARDKWKTLSEDKKMLYLQMAKEDRARTLQQREFFKSQDLN